MPGVSDGTESVMRDYGHDIQFGYFLNPDAGDPKGTVDIARFVDELGYDLIGIQDHPYVADHLDAYALLATVLAVTERVRVFPDVTNMQMRPAALVAKAAASMDQLSGGRFELGLGGGAPFFADKAVAMGAIPMSPGDTVDGLEETIAVCRALWSGQPNARVTGVFHQLAGIQGGPQPAHDMEIWIGASGPRMLRLIGQAADGWIIPLMQYVPPSQVEEKNLIIDEAAQANGRNPADIRRIYNCTGQFTDEVKSGASDDDTKITGLLEHWVEVLTHQAIDFGISTFLLVGPPSPVKLKTFINEVAPQVKERVTQHRQG
jgi:alkanesulfonate monooxygenase SsuD/methylene tetrahydromethanopterin reductase-like flavin-dependent oxidoreductase (luciferase family)